MDKRTGTACEMKPISAWFMYLSLPRLGVFWMTACLLRWKDIHAWGAGRGRRRRAERERERAQSAGMNNWWHKLLPKSNQNSGNWTIESPSIRRESQISPILLLILVQSTRSRSWSFTSWAKQNSSVQSISGEDAGLKKKEQGWRGRGFHNKIVQ